MTKSERAIVLSVTARLVGPACGMRVRMQLLGRDVVAELDFHACPPLFFRGHVLRVFGNGDFLVRWQNKTTLRYRSIDWHQGLVWLDEEAA